MVAPMALSHVGPVDDRRNRAVSLTVIDVLIRPSSGGARVAGDVSPRELGSRISALSSEFDRRCDPPPAACPTIGDSVSRGLRATA